MYGSINLVDLALTIAIVFSIVLLAILPINYRTNPRLWYIRLIVMAVLLATLAICARS